MGCSWKVTAHSSRDRDKEETAIKPSPSRDGQSRDDGIKSDNDYNINLENSKSIPNIKSSQKLCAPSKKVRCLSTNIRSIGAKTTSGVLKRDELLSMCVTYKIDLIFIVESWTNSDDSNESINLKGYNVVCRVDKSSVTGKGGGIIIFANENLKGVRHLCTSDSDPDLQIQSASIEIRTSNSNVVTMHAIYRSPN